MKQFDFQEGEVLLINKPLHWTSFDVVKKVRYAIKVKKVGHAGTLDPLATGLVILCTGKKTKTIEGLMGQDKEYIGELELGATTPSYDLETAIDKTFSIEHITEESIRDTALKMTGVIEQTPPAHSAIRVDGKRAYTLARQGKDPKLKSRQVTIYDFEILEVNLPRVTFKVSCSKGTYIRSLANDFGKLLDSGAHLTALKRTKIGDFLLENAYELDDLITIIQSQRESIQRTK